MWPGDEASFKSVHSDTVNVLTPFLFCMQDTSKSVCGSLIKVNRTYTFSYASVYGLLLVTVLLGLSLKVNHAALE